jgi:uncharacterized protein YueI
MEESTNDEELSQCGITTTTTTKQRGRKAKRARSRKKKQQANEQRVTRSAATKTLYELPDLSASYMSLADEATVDPRVVPMQPAKPKVTFPLAYQAAVAKDKKSAKKQQERQKKRKKEDDDVTTMVVPGKRRRQTEPCRE